MAQLFYVRYTDTRHVAREEMTKDIEPIYEGPVDRTFFYPMQMLVTERAKMIKRMEEIDEDIWFVSQGVINFATMDELCTELNKLNHLTK